MPRLDRDKAMGAMLGLAVGDAAGAPDGRGTSATQLALRLANAVAEVGGYDPDHALRSYVAWYRSDPPDMSGHMREVLAAVAGGDDAFRATSSFHFGGGVTSGNEALTRATPLAVALAGRDGQLRDATLADASLTHFDPLAGKVALLHNQVVSWLATDGPQRLYDELRNPEWLDDRIEDVVIPASHGVRGFAERLVSAEPGAALTALAVGLVAAYNADTFDEGVAWAVGLGGDAPANAAVTGAMLGARFGAQAIPQPSLAALERRAEIEALTERLIALAR